MKVGVLALQGAFREHLEAFDALGTYAVPVRLPEHLDGVDALVLPGGESTVLRQLLTSSGVAGPLRSLLRAGTPTLATCAGLILVAREVVDAASVDADGLDLAMLDCAIRRNAYGPQVASFEAALSVTGLPGGTFPGVFIRAPVIERFGERVEVLASHDERPVLVREGSVLGAAFHPELAQDLRLHQHFLTGIGT